MTDAVVGAAVGVFGSILGAFVSFRVAKTSWHRQHTGASIKRALVAAYLYRKDMTDLWNDLHENEVPDPTGEPDPEAAAQVGGEYLLKVLEEARRRVIESEREIIAAAAELALWTDLYDSDPRRATGFDTVYELVEQRHEILRAPDRQGFRQGLVQVNVLIRMLEEDLRHHLRTGKPVKWPEKVPVRIDPDSGRIEFDLTPSPSRGLASTLLAKIKAGGAGIWSQ